MKNIELNLTIDETNLVLEALGNLPFAQVFQLVGKIQNQAASQLAEPSAPAAGEAVLEPQSNGKASKKELAKAN